MVHHFAAGHDHMKFKHQLLWLRQRVDLVDLYCHGDNQTSANSNRVRLVENSLDSGEYVPFLELHHASVQIVGLS